MRNPRLHSPIGTGNPATHTLRRRRWRKTIIETKILEDRITGKIKPETEQLDQTRLVPRATPARRGARDRPEQSESTEGQRRRNESINRSRRRNGTKSEESEKRKRDEATRRARRRTP
ncbi:hypothetical protein PVAP13_3KG373408 [Panicum virgatum]|uniref:Uncharacterized protein n=1 Tax=Panicum virgatum TaxID=38727 RepID=A0A8T0V3B1_PANVG|nr:hypothetical protein PVAP13_3KG373408 [Panicum virgatum]